jgi:hypothetical protein
VARRFSLNATVIIPEAGALFFGADYFSALNTVGAMFTVLLEV